jgi:hypothetical protein
MSAPTPHEDLLDLRMLPSWANEPSRPNEYADFEGDDSDPTRQRPDRPRRRDRDRQDRRKPDRANERPSRDNRSRPSREPRRDRPPARAPRPEIAPEPLAVTIRFLPHQRSFESVVAQIKSSSVAYSVFALARLFLEKPERYEVRVTMPEGTPLFQLGENGPVAVDRAILEGSAFATMRDDFYSVEVTQTEPIKGNFTNVARCRLSGTLLGPTNHHAYQPQLRNLYETRFSRRMSFADYQRQIEVVSDPAVVEQWKEQARNVTTYHVKDAEPAVSFPSSADAERHFRQTFLPSLLREANEFTISGVMSRRLADRRLGRAIEDAWSQETRSPAKMMQELAAGLRQAGLNIFRHRRGMLFVSPVRARVFGHERASVSASINAILEKVAATPGINRKQLAEQIAVADADATAAERAKMTLAHDLHWLIREGYVIEFNDGTLDLPRAKAPAPAAAESGEKPVQAIENVAPPTVAESATERSESIEGAAAPAGPEPVAEQAESPGIADTPAISDAPAVVDTTAAVDRPA